MLNHSEATALHDALPVGYHLHHYRIEAVLGASHFRIVYKAMYEALHSHVAIKEYFPVAWSSRKHHEADLLIEMREALSPFGAEEPVVAETCFAWGLERFLNEARIMAQVSHPGVVRIRDFFEANGTAYLIMDYADGEPLGRLLRREKTLDEERIRRLLDDVLPALEAMHALGYLHCALKPAHLYGRADGRTLLIGFGSARGVLQRRGTSIALFTDADPYTPIELFPAAGEGHCGPSSAGAAKRVGRRTAPGRGAAVPGATLPQGCIPPTATGPHRRSTPNSSGSVSPDRSLGSWFFAHDPRAARRARLSRAFLGFRRS